MPPALTRQISRAKQHLIHGEFQKILEPANKQELSFTGTKVVFTIGPACQDVDTLCKILQTGASVARVDVAWGDISYHIKSIQNLHEAMKKTRRMCAVMLNTSGREIFVKRLYCIEENGWWHHNEAYNISAGQIVTLTDRDETSSSELFVLSYKGMSKMVREGDVIYISRYLATGADSSTLYLEVVDTNETDIICKAKYDATLDGLFTVWHIERENYGPISNEQNRNPILSENDMKNIEILTSKFEIDFLSVSHTREVDDIPKVREFMTSINAGHVKLFAKLETKYSLTNLKSILNEADGIIVSRANLGLDLPVEKIASIQKCLISRCNLLGKPCVVTRVLDTMNFSPRPTRAEATDIANAVLDGADGFVLGSETLRGKFVIETIQTVLDISKQAELQFDHSAHYYYLMDEAEKQRQADIQKYNSKTLSMSSSPSETSGKSYSNLSDAIQAMVISKNDDNSDKLREIDDYHGSYYLLKLEAIASSAVRSAQNVKAKLLIIYTHSGYSAQLIAKYRPKMPILTLVVPKITTDTLKWKLEGRGTARQCLLIRGLLPMLATPKSNTDESLADAIETAVKNGVVKFGDKIVCVLRVHEDFCIKMVLVDDILKPVTMMNVEDTNGHRSLLRTASESIHNMPSGTHHRYSLTTIQDSNEEFE